MCRSNVDGGCTLECSLTLIHLWFKIHSPLLTQTIIIIIDYSADCRDLLFVCFSSIKCESVLQAEEPDSVEGSLTGPKFTATTRHDAFKGKGNKS